MTRTHATRRGVTLIELLVAMALLLVIMLILAEAFKSSVDFVRSANSTGTMISHLSGAGVVLARDLGAEHFAAEDAAKKPNGGVRLIDQRLDWAGLTGPKAWTPPVGGFFRIESYPTTPLGQDQDGFHLTKAVDHKLHFTAILPGGGEQNLFAVRSASGTQVYSSRAAEVAYFLHNTGTKTDPGPSGQEVYNLVRRYRLVALDDQVAAFPANVTVAGEEDVLSKNSGTNGINTLATVKDLANRMTPAQFGAANARYGDDILLSNVLSFEVLADWTPHTAAAAPYVTAAPRAFGTTPTDNSESPFDYLPGAHVFDTANPQMYARIKTLQITIRVWDPRVKQARQNTWKFAM